MIQTRNAIALLSLSLAFVLGCETAPDNPATFGVSGTVTYKGKPVEGATVVLVAQTADGTGAVGNTDASGKFAVGTFGDGDGAVPGEYKIKVFKYDLGAEPADDGNAMSEEEEEESYTGEDEVEEGKNELPPKYEDPYKSGLEVTVVDTAVVVDLDLK